MSEHLLGLLQVLYLELVLVQLSLLLLQAFLHLPFGLLELPDPRLPLSILLLPRLLLGCKHVPEVLALLECRVHLLHDPQVVRRQLVHPNLQVPLPLGRLRKPVLQGGHCLPLLGEGVTCFVTLLFGQLRFEVCPLFSQLCFVK